MYGSHFVSSKSLLVVSLVFAALAASANTIKVPGDHPTIQAAIDAATGGDTVLVSDGTYTENIDFKGKAITVKSLNGAALTIIDGNAANTVVTFSTQETAESILDGFTVRNGANAPNSPTSGSGIYVAGSSPTIQNNIITGNWGCQGSGIDVQFGSPVIQGNTIANNKQAGCSGGTGGGGILIGGASQPQILNNTISNNSTGVDGGGISLFAAGTPTISGNIISGNTAAGVGGGIAMANDSDAIVTDNVFTGNAAFQGGGIATLVPSGASGPSIVNNTFFADVAPTGGSELYIDGFYSQTNIFNNVFMGSPSQTAVLCDTLYSSNPPIFQFNDTYSPQGTALGGACGALGGTDHNISADPLFVNASDLRLQPTSPGVDAGSNSAPHIPEKDIAGNDRILDASGHCKAAVDLGAYELGQNSSLTLNPSSITFPAQLIGSTSTALASSITNNGSAALTVCSININGDFAQTNTCAGSIAGKGSCSVSITFAPTAHGQRTGFAQIITSDAGSHQTISLSGTAVAPIFSASPTMFRFPASQQVGTTSPPTTITVTNTGDGPLHISDSTTTADFAQTNNCPDPLNPNVSCAYSVTFSPTAAGERSGFLTITDNTGAHPIALYGAGTDFSLAAVNQGGKSATVAAGSTANYSLALAAANGFNSTVSLTCTGAPSQAVCTVSPASITPTGAAAQFAVSVTTTAPSSSGMALIPPVPVWRLPLWAMLLTAMALAVFSSRRVRVRESFAYRISVVALLFVIAWSTGCGSSSTPPQNTGTPKGNYTLTVTATANGVSRPLKLSLTVN